MRFASLGSGSQGNGTLIEWSDGALLLDCGFSMKEAELRLARLERSPRDLSALLVTHEHGDHIKGIAAMARRYQLPVYMTPGTYHSRDLGVIPQLRLIEGYRAFRIGSLEVEPVPVPHDAREPSQFIFCSDGIKFGVLTDLGSISPHVEERYCDCDALLLEANHDPVMLASGPYPPSLKQRVGGAWGHLSNQQTAGFLARVDTDKLQALVIAHISQKNNSLAAARAVLDPVTQSVARVQYACQDEGFGWIQLRAPLTSAALA
ncbi:MBL fold metallo-hydrolase [Gilvimarinus sp. SDUM040013]|uniref:MBL fold metallo-hydrolase n=1 Tax=Gilvimarinus gilvus TaxID=3058038 RepID=A0ABU4RWP5_9GAMM|nr:MBL fold metallo-hydrolase [Gilvimarinus sp. SDUM040013]MDO3386503.1 MBL fold metallo-hydrolase [Gilvimarinus sp. SDUM040013]MDX6849079.1 MBL fold metallo-hydrolase [Gilvimarinus sp. SDUM040013]